MNESGATAVRRSNGNRSMLPGGVVRIRSLVIVVLLAALGFSAAACRASTPSSPSSGEPTATPTAPDGAASGSRVAPGLGKLADGRDQAVGVLEYRDLEGGTWVVVDNSGAAGSQSKVVAVVANPNRFSATLQKLRGQLVAVTGRLTEGASIRMSGPEITAGSIEAVKDVGGAAE